MLPSTRNEVSESGEIELPHPAEALVIELGRFVAPRHEALTPGSERVGVVQPQDFDVGHVQAGALDSRQHLGKAWNVAAREDVFPDPGIGRAGNVVAPDRVEQHHSVIIELAARGGEKFVVAADADMFEHADRDDAVEGFMNVAVVLKPKFDPVGQACLTGSIGRDGELLAGQSDAGHLGSCDPGEIEPHAAKTAADVERRRAVLRQELGGDVALLRHLRVVERLAGIFEIGAAVLAVRIEEEIVETRVEVIVAGDVAPGAPSIVALV